jgi:tight adherence protein C
MSHFAQQPYVLYTVILIALTCFVFAVATFFQPASTAASARRAAPMQWVVTGISSRLVPKDEREQNALRLWLLQAGYDASNAAQTYYGIRILIAIGLPAIVYVGLPLYMVIPQHVLWFTCVIAGLIGFLSPVFVVRAQRSSRQRQFRNGLPDVLDLLLVCSESGLGIDMAIMKVAEEMAEPHPLLAEQLELVGKELRAGLARSVAMRSLADRTGIEETISLVNLLVQSDALGTSLADTLRAFALDMRAHRMLNAENEGHKVSAKLTIILVVCFLPSIFASLLAPALYTAVTGIQKLAVVAPW